MKKFFLFNTYIFRTRECKPTAAAGYGANCSPDKCTGPTRSANTIYPNYILNKGIETFLTTLIL